jgi:hypothetical protein
VRHCGAGALRGRRAGGALPPSLRPSLLPDCRHVLPRVSTVPHVSVSVLLPPWKNGSPSVCCLGWILAHLSILFHLSYVRPPTCPFVLTSRAEACVAHGVAKRQMPAGGALPSHCGADCRRPRAGWGGSGRVGGLVGDSRGPSRRTYRTRGPTVWRGRSRWGAAAAVDREI